MKKTARIITTLFMVLAVTGVYSFGLQGISSYAGENQIGQKTEAAVEAEAETDINDTGDSAGDSGEEQDPDQEDAEDSVAIGAKGAPDGQEDDDAELTVKGLAEEGTFEGQEDCDFDVSYDESKYPDGAPVSYADGVLTITGDVTVSMKEGKDSTTQRIVVADNCALTIDGVNIEAAGGPAIKINAGVKAELLLADSSKNTVTGADNYAGVEVGYADNNLARLTIDGNGSIDAKGGNKSAGIGGSNNNTAVVNGTLKTISSYCGDIVINGGTIKATGGGQGAGIGSGGNNNHNWDGTTNTSASFKMQYNKLGDITITGGHVEAYAGGEGAGLGGGSHTDTGMITIKGDAYVKAVGSGSGAGIGNGCGSSKNKGGTGEKGPGEFIAYITIEGNPTVEAYGDRNGAGIGGGMYCDAAVTISGGTVTAVGGHGDKGSYHHGGAGIGGGYVGHAQIEITGGTIDAKAGYQSGAAGIGSGGTANTNPSRGSYTGRTSEDILLTQTTVSVSGENTVINSVGGEYGGAGIGGGTGSDSISVSIAGGTIYAQGGMSSEDKKLGGAGIGSGLRGDKATTGKSDYYFTDTTVDVEITSGDVIAIGGWGASGIGSGANNPTAKSVTIKVAPGVENGATIQAYADGTKFAIDTRQLNDDNSTDSITKGRDIKGDVLQGTFVHEYDQPVSEDETLHQGTEGLEKIEIINERTGEVKTLKLMPEGYRSFATNVNGSGAYTVYTDDKAISNGSGRYFNKCEDDTRTPKEVLSGDDIKERNVQYTVSSNGLCDNFYLFPVKTVTVEKIVQGGNTNKLNATVYFCLKSDKGFAMKLNESGQTKIWVESIEIKNGEPQKKAIFSDVDDAAYDVWEITGFNEDGSVNTASPNGNKYGSYVLSKITTQHGDTISLSIGTVRDEARHITYTMADNGDGTVTITASMDMDNGSPAGKPVTLSIYADGELTDYEAHKLNDEKGWETSWILPASNNGTAIQYGIADTSNNANIDETIWNDEVKIINTYEGAKKKLKITKELPDFIDHRNGNEKMSDVNATFVFSITGKYENGTKDYNNVISMDFTRDSDYSQTVTVTGIPDDIQDLDVQEINQGNYKSEVVSSALSKPGEDGVYRITFRNTFDEEIDYEGGVTNSYVIKNVDGKKMSEYQKKMDAMSTPLDMMNRGRR